MLKWYLNIGLFLATMYWVEYLILPTQTTNEKVLSVYEEDFVKYKTETGIKFTMDMHYLKKGDYVDLSFSPILKQVKRIEIKGTFKTFETHSQGKLLVFLACFLIFLLARIKVGKKIVVKPYPFIKVAISTFLFLALSLLFFFK